jgi:hypothetical protein
MRSKSFVLFTLLVFVLGCAGPVEAAPTFTFFDESFIELMKKTAANKNLLLKRARPGIHLFNTTAIDDNSVQAHLNKEFEVQRDYPTEIYLFVKGWDLNNDNILNVTERLLLVSQNPKFAGIFFSQE